MFNPTIRPLAVDQTVNLYPSDIGQHFIDINGDSPLPCYQDSIFSVLSHYSSSNKVQFINYYSVTRILKSDVDLPLNIPVSLTNEKVSALRINGDGLSSRPDLNQFKFEVTSDTIKGLHIITKLNK